MSEPRDPASRLDDLVSRFEADARTRPVVEGEEAEPPTVGTHTVSPAPSATALPWAGEILAEVAPPAAIDPKPEPGPAALPEPQPRRSWWSRLRRALTGSV